MAREMLKELSYSEKIVEIIRRGLSDEELRERLSDFHYNDIANSLSLLTKEERIALYNVLGVEWMSDVITYLDEPQMYIEEIGIEVLAKMINEMDSDDAVDLLDNINEEVKVKLRPILNHVVKENIKLIRSYDEDQIGSLITTNYICVKETLTVKQTLSELISQAEYNDNVSTIYVVHEDGTYCGAIDLKDLIVAGEGSSLSDLIMYSYPYLPDTASISENIETIKSYSEDSLPVLNDSMKIVGIITATDVVELVDDEMGDDYAKLAGLTAEEDLKESTKDSMKKRLPWLVALLAMGMMVSTVVGTFEGVVAVLPIVMCFQSLILDMAGNVGTQSLGVTIRVLMDENLTTKDKIALIIKEARVGLCNGLLLGILALAALGLYITFFKGYALSQAFMISGCVGIALLTAMVISSIVGTVIPLFFNRIHVDPAVASGPLITTVNDLVAVVTYYGLSWIFLIRLLHIV